MFPLELVEKDFGYALANASYSKSKVPLVQTAHAVIQSAIGQGLAQENLTAMAKLYG
jgi:3-hydroxyisobutyrate dehydrogenase-like beta-hydroxyacid dehydrogenase